MADDYLTPRTIVDQNKFPHMLQAYCLVLDNITDNSVTRRGQPCWLRFSGGFLPSTKFIRLAPVMPREADPCALLIATYYELLG
ncbi:unnamed protein product [Eruca vesicaria subsp. sativa]|uniref:Uncharacterized protein n=1 Tax=Eruca vesicaria subsp. sativa TaxID=29727 RepID=A0ABC8J4C6_ERUVS|nr:unnamed protein product [Eruca vesicaria subsp. sativa]